MRLQDPFELAGPTFDPDLVLVNFYLAKVCALHIPVTSTLENARRTVHGVSSWYLTTQEVAMNAFHEHHQDSIRFGYRCFDRILLNPPDLCILYAGLNSIT